MPTNSTFRSGLRPLLQRREPGVAKLRPVTEEVSAALLLMQEAHFEQLGTFYCAGGRLIYDKSVNQKILVEHPSA